MEKLTENIKRLLPNRQQYESDSDMLLRRLGFVKKRRLRKDQVVNNAGDPHFMEQTHRVFPAAGFVYGDMYEAINTTATMLADALSDKTPETTKMLLIDFGVKVTPIIEAAAPFAMTRDKNDIAGRIGHTIATAQSHIKVRNNEPLMSHVQRDQIIFAYSDALTNATSQTLNEVCNTNPFPGQVHMQLSATD